MGWVSPGREALIWKFDLTFGFDILKPPCLREKFLFLWHVFDHSAYWWIHSRISFDPASSILLIMFISACFRWWCHVHKGTIYQRAPDPRIVHTVVFRPTVQPLWRVTASNRWEGCSKSGWPCDIATKLFGQRQLLDGGKEFDIGMCCIVGSGGTTIKARE